MVPALSMGHVVLAAAHCFWPADLGLGVGKHVVASVDLSLGTLRERSMCGKGWHRWAHSCLTGPRPCHSLFSALCLLKGEQFPSVGDTQVSL